MDKRIAKRRPNRNKTNEAWEKDRQYGIVIDAGSSGSRIYVYSWKDHEYTKSTLSLDERKGRLPMIERGDQHGLKWTQRVEPGISTFGSRPHEVGEHLGQLLDFAKEIIPADKQASSPVYLMATAGMRLLPEDERKEVMSSTCSFLKNNYSFQIDDCDAHIQVISGEREGVYGWVAINYLMGGFDTSNTRPSKHKNKKVATQTHTFGFLDMGGASAQIAFEPESAEKQEHMDDLTKIHLYTMDDKKSEYDVFVATFLGYGSAEVRRRYLEQRILTAYQEASGKNMLDENHLLQLDDPCLPVNLSVTDDSASVSLKLNGTGNFNECLSLTSSLLNKDAKCPEEPCLFNGVHTPRIDWSINKFVGVSEYWYSSQDILGLGGVYDFAEFEKKSSEYCAQDWTALIQEHQDLTPTEVSRYQLQCFKSAWIMNVLHDGFEIPRISDPSKQQEAKVDPETLEKSLQSVANKNWSPPFQSIDTINDIQVSWTLGVMMLIVSNQIPMGKHIDHEQDAMAGIELPSSTHTNTLTDLFDGLVRQTRENPVMGITVALSVILMAILCCYSWRRIVKRLWNRDYRRVDLPAGGLLGTETTTQGWPSLPMSKLRGSLSSMWRWVTSILPSQVYSRSATDDVPSRDIPTIGLGERAWLGHSSKTKSEIFHKYWKKKRYSGDSYSLTEMMQSSSSSALGRIDSSGNLVARAAMSPNTNGPSTSIPMERNPSPLVNGTGAAVLIGRSRSRIGIAIHELSDEDEYTLSDSQILTSPNRSMTSSPAISTHTSTTPWPGNRMTSPKESPRGSQDEPRQP